MLGVEEPAVLVCAYLLSCIQHTTKQPNNNRDWAILLCLLVTSQVAQWWRVCLPMQEAFDPWSGRYAGRGNGNPVQYSCLENSMDRGAWWPTVPGVAKSHSLLRDWAHAHTHTQTHTRTHTFWYINGKTPLQMEISFVNINISYKGVVSTWFSELLPCLLFFEK